MYNTNATSARASVKAASCRHNHKRRTNRQQNSQRRKNTRTSFVSSRNRPGPDIIHRIPLATSTTRIPFTGTTRLPCNRCFGRMYQVSLEDLHCSHLLADPSAAFVVRSISPYQSTGVIGSIALLRGSCRRCLNLGL